MSPSGIMIHTDTAMSPDLSVVILFHNEGWIAHRTLRSVARALEYAQARGVRWEAILVLDRPHPRVDDIVRNWREKSGSQCHICPVQFGDPGLARNCGIDRSVGTFVAILDGDDVVGENWLYAGLMACSSTNGVIAHPELNYYFPFDRIIFAHREEDDLGVLLEHNRWTCAIIAKRTAFEEIRYRPHTEAFRYEDWLWNCEAVAKGYQHVVVPRTLIAVRQKQPGNSHNAPDGKQGKTIPPNDLFRTILSTTRNNDSAVSLRGIHTDLQSFGWKYFTKTLAKRILASRFLDPVKRRVTPEIALSIKMFLKESAAGASEIARSFNITSGLPKWAEEEFKELARIEPELRGGVSPRWHRPNSRLHRYVTEPMKLLVESHKARVFVLPWLIEGGADLEAVHYMHAVDGPRFLITTERSPNPWLRLIPDECIHIDIGNNDLSHRERMVLLSRLLLQANPDFIHTVNSPVAFDVFTEWPRAFANIRMYATLFCNEISPDGRECGYAVSHFPRLLDFFTRVSTDNVTFQKQLERTYGLDENMIVAHRMPFSPPHFPMVRLDPGPSGGTERENSPLRLLFAGRFCRQKRPDVAIQVVNELLSEGANVTLDVWGIPFGGETVKVPKRPGIRLMGSFSGIAQVPLVEYDALLLPSLWEGLPNIVIECMGNGVPVIASNVGGLSEIITEETGWLVDEYLTTDGFKRVIREILAGKQCVARKSKKSSEFVAMRHSWSAFLQEARIFYRDRFEADTHSRERSANELPDPLSCH